MSNSQMLPASLLVLAAALFLNAPSRSTSQAQDEAKRPEVQWEYRVVRANEDILNGLGAEGWEVVAAYGDVKGQSAGMRAINTIDRAILKRRKVD